MCGICGFTGAADRSVLKRMADRIVHRGPDEEGFYADGSVNLAIRRLSIVDVQTGHQPIHNEDSSLWTVFNGELYDYPDLRESLAGAHRFYTDHSDTELVVHLYEQYGRDWPVHVNGMFAAALWDAGARELLLYRDRIGKKPLYYALKGGQLIFGSEIKAVLAHPAVGGELDYAALYHYFGMKNVSAPRTAYADVRQLLPGHVLVWRAGQVTTRPFWKVDFSRCDEGIGEEEAADRLLALLEDAVRIRMRCDVPYGAYLSGGVDSSSVVALMSRQQSRAVKTFALGYEDPASGQFVGKHSDMHYARLMSKRLGTEHYEHVISAEQFARDMPGVIRAFDEPFSGTVSTFALTTLISQHVKVALSGDGADELFGSYLPHRLAMPVENLLALRARGKSEYGDLDDEDKALLWPLDQEQGFAFLSGLASADLASWRGKLMVFSHDERRALLSEDFLRRAGQTEDLYEALAGGLTARDALNRSLEIDQRELLPNQVLPFVDRLSMAHSVEVRCPYLDWRMIELANRLPGRLKIARRTVKYIHKKAMAKLLPADLLRRAKEGFVQPVYSWMQGPLRGWAMDWLRSLPPEMFSPAETSALMDAFGRSDRSVDAKVWNLVCFSIWHQVAVSAR